MPCVWLPTLSLTPPQHVSSWERHVSLTNSSVLVFCMKSVITL